jgi:hypothetical protein
MQYEEYEDQLVFRQNSSGAMMIIVILIAFILIPLGVLSSIINVNLVYIVVILGLGFILWFAYPWFTLCELIVKQKERALIPEVLKDSLRCKKRG